MRSSVSLVALVAIPGIGQTYGQTYGQTHGQTYSQAQGAADEAPRLPRRFEVRPPKGFRPSETPAMLADILATSTIGGYKPHALLYTRITPTGSILQIHCELLRSQDGKERAGLRHVIGFAKSNGFSITADEATSAERTALRDALTEIDAADLLTA